MKNVLRILSFVGLALMLGASIGYYRGTVAVDQYHVAALIGTVLWFVTVPFWMKRRLHQSD